MSGDAPERLDPAPGPYRVVLASASPARLATLRKAGVQPEVRVSGVDETQADTGAATDLVLELAERKATAVSERLEPDRRTTLVIGCDSVLELDGQVYGKPSSPIEAVQRWDLMRGRSGVLHTGHCVIRTGVDDEPLRVIGSTESTVVHFARLNDAEVTAYVATGEPLEVAGAFTIDGLGGPFVRRIEGDPHAVVGISLPLLRELLLELGVSWTDLWAVEG